MSKGFEWWHDDMTLVDFKAEVYELAFGADAIDKGHTDKEVLEKIKEFKTWALELDAIEHGD